MPAFWCRNAPTGYAAADYHSDVVNNVYVTQALGLHTAAAAIQFFASPNFTYSLHYKLLRIHAV